MPVVGKIHHLFARDKQNREKFGNQHKPCCRSGDLLNKALDSADKMRKNRGKTRYVSNEICNFAPKYLSLAKRSFTRSRI